MSLTSVDPLIEAAMTARAYARATFSKFCVGSAVMTRDGRIFTGCNIESSSYGLTICAERVAVFKALSEGAYQFTRVAVVVDTPRLTPPCGACRQILWDFCSNAELTLANLHGEQQTLSIRDIFPKPFDASFL